MWILIGETFPTRTRAKQGAIATASNWLWNFLLAFFTPFITRNIQYRYGFVFAGACAVCSTKSWLASLTFVILVVLVAACNLLGAVVVYFFLYESSDISLEGVDQVRLPCAHP